jgi:cyclic pyranopterin phosphate synthase
MNEFKILSLNISEKKGEAKYPVNEVKLKVKVGITNDAHQGDWHRQISLLAQEDINIMSNKGVEIGYGDFAENITTSGVDLSSLPIGTKLFIDDAVLEVTQIGKKCHQDCQIFKKIGDCVMPRKGIFTKVIKDGVINCESHCYYTLG